MGLLDEAIREHLELKRRRGADPSVIAREEQEALEPVLPDEPVALDETLDSEPHHTPGISDQLAPAGAEPAEDGHRVPGSEMANPSSEDQETAELDVPSMLDEHDAAPTGLPRARPVAASSEEARPSERPTEADAREWDVPERSAHEIAPEEAPGQERLAFE